MVLSRAINIDPLVLWQVSCEKTKKMVREEANWHPANGDCPQYPLNTHQYPLKNSAIAFGICVDIFEFNDLVLEILSVFHTRLFF